MRQGCRGSGGTNGQADETEPHSGVQGEVALAAVKGDKTLAAQYFDVHPNQITDWKSRLLAGATAVFGPEGGRQEPIVDVKTLHAKIGELTLENDFFRRRIQKVTQLLGDVGNVCR